MPSCNLRRPVHTDEFMPSPVHGGCSADTCVVACTGPDACLGGAIACPAGWNCEIDCAGSQPGHRGGPHPGDSYGPQERRPLPDAGGTIEAALLQGRIDRPGCCRRSTCRRPCSRGSAGLPAATSCAACSATGKPSSTVRSIPRPPWRRFASLLRRNGLSARRMASAPPTRSPRGARWAARGGQAPAPGHRDDLRRRPQRRRCSLHRDGVRRGAYACRARAGGGAAPRRGPAHRRGVPRGARVRPCPGHRPPGPEAVEHPDHRRRASQEHGLRGGARRRLADDPRRRDPRQPPWPQSSSASEESISAPTCSPSAWCSIGC